MAVSVAVSVAVKVAVGVFVGLRVRTAVGGAKVGGRIGGASVGCGGWAVGNNGAPLAAVGKTKRGVLVGEAVGVVVGLGVLVIGA